jgi:hypothetical protein
MSNLIEKIRVVSAEDGLEVITAQNGEINFDSNEIKLQSPGYLNSDHIDQQQQLNVFFDYDGDSFLLKKLLPSTHKPNELVLSPGANANGKLLYRSQEINESPSVGQKTTLDSVIAPIPWDESFNFGAGVDAITGDTKATALEVFTPPAAKGKNVQENYQFVQNKEDYERLIKVSVSGKYNIAGVNISGSASFTNKIEFSSTCTTLVADYQSLNDSYDELADANGYKLTEKALQLMKDSSEKFRGVYGDYFIAGIKKASRFTALYKCTAKTAKELNEFIASFGVDSPGVFEVNASTEFKKAASKYGIQIDVEVHYYGISGASPVSAPWTPEKVIEALQWFKVHQEPQPVNVKLKHYNTIEPSYPLTINVSPEIFAELSFLFQQLWVITTEFNSCPRLYTDPYKEDYVYFTKSLVAAKAVLATDENLRAMFKDVANNLSEKLQDILVRQAFYFKIKDQEEPGNAQSISASNGVRSWSYGIKSATDDAIVLSSEESNHNQKASTLAWVQRKHTFNSESKDTKSEWLIVGWEVISHWTDGSNGKWKKSSNRIIGSNKASVLVESKPGRGFSWGMKVYYVNAADYRFE